MDNTPASPEQIDNAPRSGIAGFVAGGVLILALQAIIVSFAWKHVMVAQLGLPLLGFGPAFLLLAVYHLIFRDMFGLLQKVETDESMNVEMLLTDIRDMQILSEKARAFQYNATVLLMAELIRERDEAKALAIKAIASIEVNE